MEAGTKVYWNTAAGARVEGEVSHSYGRYTVVKTAKGNLSVPTEYVKLVDDAGEALADLAEPWVSLAGKLAGALHCLLIDPLDVTATQLATEVLREFKDAAGVDAGEWVR